ncbi:MAG: hypothetical protein ABI871_03510 [Chthoniobacterales bacterium]
MKRFVLLVMAAAVTAFAIWYYLHRRAEVSANAVAALLPRDTLVLLQIADVSRTRSEWHKSDLYKIWREPAVQAFLKLPLANITQKRATAQTLREIESLGMKDAFLAVAAINQSAWKIVGGFRFEGSAEDAEKVAARWRAKFIDGSTTVKRETVQYQQHQIEVESAGMLTISSCYNGEWFVASQDVEQLKLLLDRIDRRQNNRATTLAGDETFGAARKQMPSQFGLLAYARIDRLFHGLLPEADKTDAEEPGTAQPLYRKMRNVCATLGFDDGKMRGAVFIGMPQAVVSGNQSRSSLPIATKDAFLYAAGFLALPTVDSSGPAATGPPLRRAFGSVVGSFAASGVTLADWNSAFGPEFGTIGEWPATARFPALLATMQVRDFAKAQQILSAMTAADTAHSWTRTEQNGAVYFSTQAGTAFLPLSPTLVLSNKIAIAGLDLALVQSAIGRVAKGTAELAETQTFRSADRLLPRAKQAFAYIDSSLLYTRFDAAIRPMIFMGAAFLPGITQKVDLGKLPPADAITRHLSPIVMTQSYRSDGYLTESVGPVTMDQAVIGFAAAVATGVIEYRHHVEGIPGGFRNLVDLLWPGPPLTQPALTPAPLPSLAPSATP